VKDESKLPFHPRIGDQLKLRKRATLPDGRPHVPYIYSDDLILAVNAALATDRPLLVRGDPGCGKSTLARDVAFSLGREYLEEVVTSRTTAADLQWRFDAVHRLHDAAAGSDGLKPPDEYIRPGVLWRAFQRRQGLSAVVVLLDEIDKADPDVPNDLLLPLGEGRIVVTDAVKRQVIARDRAVLVVITTNGERELPPAFLRRCVSITLDDPSKRPELLLQIANEHLARDYAERAKEDPRKAGPQLTADPALLEKLVARVADLTNKLAFGARRSGTAEILDALRATISLKISPEDPAWEVLTRVLLYKEAGNPDVKGGKAQ